MSEEIRLAKPGIKVELVVGEQWNDDLSGISLNRGFYRLASSDELKLNKKTWNLGYVKDESIRKPVAVLPKDKNLSRVEKALRLGILKIFDENNPTEYEIKGTLEPKKIFDKDSPTGDKFVKLEDQKLEQLLKMKHKDFTTKLKEFTSIGMLEKIYDAECEGMNPTAGPRKAYIDSIKSRMKDKDIKGVTNIKETEEKEEIVII